MLSKMSDLENMRFEIDQINTEIVSSISKRINIAKKIANYKKDHGLSIIDEKREEYVISLFEKECINKGMRIETGRILARALIDAAIEEEEQLINKI